MSLTTELGISPVLLQAITHTLASRGRHASGGSRTVSSGLHLNDTSTENKMNMMREENVSRAQKVVAHILQDMNEPVSALLHQGHSDQDRLQFDPHDQDVVKDTTAVEQTQMELLRQRLDGPQVMTEGLEEGLRTENTGEQIIITDSDVSMVNVLTAIASHHLKAGSKTMPVPVQLVSSAANKISDDSNSQPQYVVCYGGEEVTVPSPAANDIVVSEAEAGLPLDYLNVRKIYVNQNGEPQLQGPSPVKRVCLESSLTEGGESIQSDSGSNGVMNLVLNSDMTPGSMYQVQSETPSEQDPTVGGIGSSCPICGDRVSGYHYGIFSCESCKGFFKRTVQNKKSFSCLRTGDCEINISNRKKCPACRFQKCLVNGMKLEAIRSDRTRGGRSYYDGCSPHGKSKTSPLTNVGSTGPNVPRFIFRDGDTAVEKTGIPVGEEGGDGRLASTSSSQLVAILNRPSKADPTSENPNLIKPYVPQVLTDIMNLESFLSDEDLSQEMGQEKISEDNMYTSLMQLTELRLYKLVRWARNLPQFSAIATDDQILLLQHCWSDLLVLGVCWPSIPSANELRLAFGKSINREKAIAMDIEDVFDRMMSVTAQLRRLHVDNYEFVALKVLILISPDVKGLKDPDKIRDQQDKICDALHVYTASHYPQYPNKFGEMLLRLPEIARCSLVGKDYLSSRQITGDLPSCSLLLELIRGENEVKDT